MWPFPGARAGSGCACCDAWCDEVGLRAYFFQGKKRCQAPFPGA